MLTNAFEIYVKSVKKIPLIDEEIDVLNYCTEHSIYPLEIAVSKQPLPFPDFSFYDYFRPDKMHTKIGRIKSWVFNTVICLARMGMDLKGEYRQVLYKLDDAISQFLPRHSLPFEFERFEDGVTEYCRASTDSRAKFSTTGLGKLDCQRVPSLVLQMLISKSSLI
jgi:hypothetical protein